MRSYSLNWNESLKDIMLSYDVCRKVYLDDSNKINLLLKEDVSNDDYHLYTYNDKVKFLIKEIKVENNKIDNMVVYLLSNDLEQIDSIYSKIRDEVHSIIDSYIYIYNYKEESKKDYSLIPYGVIEGIVKNFSKCANIDKLAVSDVLELNRIIPLELKDEYYYLGDNKYLNKEDYNKFTDEICSKLDAESTIDKDLYIVLKHIGPYSTIYQTYDKLLKIINDEKMKIVGLPIEQFIHGKWDEKDENKYVTNILIPIE